jgi:protocatechuate 3,4-dioxygenase beta subunit
MRIASLGLLVTVLFAPQQPRTPAIQDDGAPALLRGRIVDRVSGAPIPRALVTLTQGNSPGAQVLSGAGGEFEFQRLVPGAYDLSVTAGELRATHVPYGAASGRAPLYGPDELKPIQLRPGEVRTGLTIALLPALAISGRVIDDAGLPLTDVSVRVTDVAAGQHYQSARGRSTDDLGVFRIFSLAPGSYRVCADVSSSPRINPRSRTREQRFVATCHGIASGGQAVDVTDADVDGIEIRMLRQSTYFIRGIVLDSTGAPAPPDLLTLSRLERGGSSSMGLSLVEGGGRFTFANVVPGVHAVSASTGGPDRPGERELEMGLVPLDVTTADLEDVVITMKKGARLRGSVAFEDGAPPDWRNDGLRIELQRIDRRWMMGSGTPAVAVRSDLSFELKELFGPYVLKLSGLPRGTAVKSILYRGDDILDIPTEFDGDPRHSVEIIVTGRVAELSGRVLDDRGNPAAGARIMIFPAEPARWGDASRGAVMIGKDGVFRLLWLAAGDYLVVAVSAEDLRRMELGFGSWHDREPWERLATIAERITLLDNDRRVVDLALRTLPREWKK